MLITHHLFFIDDLPLIRQSISIYILMRMLFMIYLLAQFIQFLIIKLVIIK